MNIIQKPITHNYSPNRSMHVSGIVVHLTAGHGSPHPWFNNPSSQASATYCVMRSGEIEQYRPESDATWHAGIKAEYLDPKYTGPHKPTWTGLKAFTNPNQYLVGIENEGTVNDAWTPQQIDSLTDLMADIAFRYGFPLDAGHVARHHDIWDMHSCPGPLCPFDQILSAAASKLDDLRPTPPIT